MFANIGRGNWNLFSLPCIFLWEIFIRKIHLQSLPVTLDEEVVIYCKAGVRSLDACKVLSELGYTKLNNLSGGMMRWRAENMPLFLLDEQ
jgi:rhodanese-related sulfurtransferase